MIDFLKAVFLGVIITACIVMAPFLILLAFPVFILLTVTFLVWFAMQVIKDEDEDDKRDPPAPP